MLIAESGGNRVTPEPKIQAVCPLCRTPVRAKCGQINIWHFAHESLVECDLWAEPETDWHRKWKEKFKECYREIVVGNHRADIKLESGLVVEFQNSPISPETLQERERFYGKDSMLWVFNATELPHGLKENEFLKQEDQMRLRFLLTPLERGGRVSHERL